jgi:ferredoxin-NADP reductase
VPHPNRGHLREVATVVGVRPGGSAATRLRLGMQEPPHVVAGQYDPMRIRADDLPGVVEPANSISSSPWPPSAEIEITVREAPGRSLSSAPVPGLVVGAAG